MLHYTTSFGHGESQQVMFTVDIHDMPIETMKNTNLHAPKQFILFLHIFSIPGNACSQYLEYIPISTSVAGESLQCALLLSLPAFMSPLDEIENVVRCCFGSQNAVFSNFSTCHNRVLGLPAGTKVFARTTQCAVRTSVFHVILFEVPIGRGGRHQKYTTGTIPTFRKRAHPNTRSETLCLCK